MPVPHSPQHPGSPWGTLVDLALAGQLEVMVQRHHLEDPLERGSLPGSACLGRAAERAIRKPLDAVVGAEDDLGGKGGCDAVGESERAQRVAATALVLNADPSHRLVGVLIEDSGYREYVMLGDALSQPAADLGRAVELHVLDRLVVAVADAGVAGEHGEGGFQLARVAGAEELHDDRDLSGLGGA